MAGIDYAKWESNESHDSLYVIAFAKTLESRPQGATVLLCHEPFRVDLAEEAGVELMLSGHTHGGQVWPFGYLVRFWYPFVVGRYEVEEMTLLVSRGNWYLGPQNAALETWRDFADYLAKRKIILLPITT